jgi:DNA-binding MarR family transcriptional regulator
LVGKGSVKDLTNPADGRVRIVRITEKGKREFLKAIPLWRQATLSDLLGLCGNALARSV